MHAAFSILDQMHLIINIPVLTAYGFAKLSIILNPSLSVLDNPNSLSISRKDLLKLNKNNPYWKLCIKTNKYSVKIFNRKLVKKKNVNFQDDHFIKRISRLKFSNDISSNRMTPSKLPGT